MTSARSREIWREIVDGTFELEESSDPNNSFKVLGHIWAAAELLFVKLNAEPNTVIRTSALIASNPTPVIKVRIYLRGSTIFEADSETLAVGSGAIHFIDHNRPTRQVSTKHEQISIFVPYHSLGYDPFVHPAITSLSLGTATGRLLMVMINNAFEALDQLDQAEAPTFTSALVGALRGAFSHLVDNETTTGSRTAQTLAIKRYIDQNLEDTKLDADRILSVFSLSRATLFRSFADVGGVGRYIIDRRIQRAYRELSESPPTRGAVKDISDRLGFSTIAHFSRTFKKQFGETPSSVIGRWASRTPNQAGENDSHQREVNSLDAMSIEAMKWSYGRFE